MAPAINTKSTRRDKTQIVWEERLTSRREEPKIEALGATIERLEKGLRVGKEGDTGGGAKAGEEGKEGKKPDVYKTRIAGLESSLAAITAAHTTAMRELGIKTNEVQLLTASI